MLVRKNAAIPIAVVIRQSQLQRALRVRTWKNRTGESKPSSLAKARKDLRGKSLGTETYQGFTSKNLMCRETKPEGFEFSLMIVGCCITLKLQHTFIFDSYISAIFFVKRKKRRFSMKTLRALWATSSVVLLIASLALISGCGGGGGGGESTPSVPPVTGTAGTITGTAIKGPVGNATVTAFSINNGIMGGQIGTGQTDNQGNFSIPVGDHSGAVMLQMRGGSYMDEATGTTMPMQQSDVMTCVIPSMAAGSTVSGIQMTPLTSVAQTMAQGMTGGMTPANITTANNAVGNYFMVNDILHTQPMNPLMQGAGGGADQNMKDYGMAMAAMSQYAKTIGMPFSSGMVTSMMNDASDGHMNGMMGNSSITMGGGMMGGSMMSSNAGTSGLANAMTQFIQSPMNKSGVTLQDMQNLINKLTTSNGVIQ